MAYSKTNWQDLPSTTTPLNATNLNKIENELSDLDSNKVNKNGDTLTGLLHFNNKDNYYAIKKDRTIDGKDYQITVGLGGNKSARMEFVQNNNVLSSVEARSDGRIWNGKSNRNMPEVAHLTWGSSFSFAIESGNHALVMLSNTDCLMLWAAGNPISLSIVRLYGNSAQATYSNGTVTIKYSDNRNFTGDAIIT